MYILSITVQWNTHFTPIVFISPISSRKRNYCYNRERNLDSVRLRNKKTQTAKETQ